MNKLFLLHGTMLMALGVALGAVASHALSLSSYHQRLFELGVHYQIYHALGLLALAIVSNFLTLKRANVIGWLMFFGIIAFSGGLYFYALTGHELIRKVIPVGGSCLIISWLLFFWAVLSHRQNEGQ